MTEIEKKALAMVNEFRVATGNRPFVAWSQVHLGATAKSLLRAIEQHEAFKLEVSDACKKWTKANVNCREPHDLDRFILPEPDEVSAGIALAVEDALELVIGDDDVNKLLAALAKRGIKTIKEDNI